MSIPLQLYNFLFSSIIEKLLNLYASVHTENPKVGQWTKRGVQQQNTHLWKCTDMDLWNINSLAPRRFDYSLKLVNFKLIATINILSIFCEIATRWMPQHLTDH